MKLTFATKFEQWLDPKLDWAWRNVPKIISIPIMTVGIVIEMFVHCVQLVLSLFVFPGDKTKSLLPDQNKTLLDNPLEDKDESKE